MATNPSIFKAYDIRGIYPDDLDEQTAHHVGRAFATMLQQENPDKDLTVIVGGDMRTSTPTLKQEVMRGLLEGGVDVVDVGLVSTPTFYFAVAFYGYDGGLQVSASHNPGVYNGFKMVRAGATPIGRDTGMQTIKDLVLAEHFPPAVRAGQMLERANVVQECREEQADSIPTETIKPYKVVIDAANGMGALDMETVFAGLPCEAIKINFELDGTFPSHPANPLEEKNLQLLKDAVREHHADLGIAPDGDGDRIFFVDEKGEVVPQAVVCGLMAQVALHEYVGGVIGYDVRQSHIIRDMIQDAGGVPLLTPVGHALIKPLMLKTGAVFGGESSGHYYYQMPYGTFEAPMILVLKFLVWLSQQSKPLSQAIVQYKKYFHSGEINSTVADVKVVLEKVQTTYHDANISLLDGVTVEYPDFWFNVRGSNTEPLVRLNLEARSKEIMEAKRDEVLTLIRS